MKHTRSTVWRDLRWGIGWGLFAGFFYSLVALAIYAFQGSRPFGSRGITFASTVAVYFFGGLTAGSIVGLLRPLTRLRVGAMAVGIVAAIPACMAGVFILYGPIAQWGAREGFVVVAGSLLFGALGGWEFWEPQD